MTVQEFIEKLEAIKDKTIPVYKTCDEEIYTVDFVYEREPYVNEYFPYLNKPKRVELE